MSLTLDPRTAAWSATIAFHKIDNTGRPGPALDWAIGEGETWAEVIEDARRNLTRAGVEGVQLMTALGTSIGQQWDIEGKSI